LDKTERFYATVERKKADRLAWWLGLPSDEALKSLCAATTAKDFYELKEGLGDDI